MSTGTCISKRIAQNGRGLSPTSSAGYFALALGGARKAREKRPGDEVDLSRTTTVTFNTQRVSALFLGLRGSSAENQKFSAKCGWVLITWRVGTFYYFNSYTQLLKRFRWMRNGYFRKFRQYWSARCKPFIFYLFSLKILQCFIRVIWLQNIDSTDCYANWELISF